jgi:large subunit ribosomal protein L31
MKTVPGYRPVAFRDVTTGDVMVIRSTVETQSTIEHGGRLLPLYDLDVSSHSHPEYTGTASRRPDSGRIERFKRRYEC